MALIFLIFVSSETINIIKKTLNPIKYVMSGVKTSVTNDLFSDKDKADEPVAAEQPAEEEHPTVVDLTPLPTEKSPSDSKKKQEGAQNAQLSDTNTPDLVVDTMEEEAEAKGKRLNAEVDLSKPINPLEPFTRYKYPTLDLLKKYDNDQRPQIDYDEIKANNARLAWPSRKSRLRSDLR